MLLLAFLEHSEFVNQRAAPKHRTLDVACVTLTERDDRAGGYEHALIRAHVDNVVLDAQIAAQIHGARHPPQVHSLVITGRGRWLTGQPVIAAGRIHKQRIAHDVTRAGRKRRGAGVAKRAGPTIVRTDARYRRVVPDDRVGHHFCLKMLGEPTMEE